MEIQPDLSVCVIGVPEEASISSLLHSLYNTAEPLEVEAVVVTGGRVAAGLNKSFPQVLFYEAARGEPEAEAGNRVLRLARGRYLALVTAATAFTAGALLRLITFLDERAEVGLVTPRLQSMEGSAVATAGIFPSPPRFLAEVGWGLFSGREIPSFLYCPAFSREVAWLNSPCLLMRRELVEEIGLPAADLSLTRNLDYGRRARRAGWRSFFLGEALVLCEQQPSIMRHPGALLVEGCRYFGRHWSGSGLR